MVKLFPWFTSVPRRQKGTALVVWSAVALLAFLAVVGFSSQELGWFNARRQLSTLQDTQLYNVALAGIQEAFATRMVPRSNRLNFVNPSNLPTVLPSSGQVFLAPETNPPSRLIGYYRTLIVGGDPARNAATGDFDPSRYLETTPTQPFFLISKGSVCLHTQTRALGINEAGGTAILGLNANGRPQCLSNAYQLAEQILVTRVNVTANGALGLNQVGSIRVLPGNQNVTLDGVPVFVPGVGIAHTFDFETAWDQPNNDNRSPHVPARVAYYAPTSTSVPAGQVIPVTAPVTTSAAVVPKGSILRVYFQGGALLRSVFADVNQTVQSCVSDANQCSIRLFNRDTNQVVTGLYPTPTVPGVTQASLTIPAGVVSGNYELQLQQTLLDSTGRSFPGTQPYRIRFTIN